MNLGKFIEHSAGVQRWLTEACININSDLNWRVSFLQVHSSFAGWMERWTGTGAAHTSGKRVSGWLEVDDVKVIAGEALENDS